MTADRPPKRQDIGFAQANAGNIGLVGACVAPLLLGLIALAVDFASGWSARSDLQSAADGAALAAARELSLRSTTQNTVQTIVDSFVRENVNDDLSLTSIEATILENRGGVTVAAAAQVGSIFGRLINGQGYAPSVEATARLAGGAPLCALALEESAGRGILLTRRARVLAPNCAVMSNSHDPRGIVAQDSTELLAAMICSAGGAEGARANFSPEPLTDCPALPDPLAGRPEPDAGGCDFTSRVTVSGDEELEPGVYCGGLRVRPGAIARLARGVYVMKDGPLEVIGDGYLVGENVGFYFVGNLSTLYFAPQSHIDLTAPRSGEMAGFLFWANRGAGGGHVTPRRFRIESNDARTLLGTIYLRDGVLEVASHRPVADRSSYTVVVARRIEVAGGPDLVLNTDYSGTDIPVPDGVGPRQQSAFLAE